MEQDDLAALGRERERGAAPIFVEREERSRGFGCRTQARGRGREGRRRMDNEYIYKECGERPSETSEMNGGRMTGSVRGPCRRACAPIHGSEHSPH